MSTMTQARRIVLHRGPIPGTSVGHHWFDALDGNRYGVTGWPHGINKGWSYEIVDADGRQVADDNLFSHYEIREWARWIGETSDHRWCQCGGASGECSRCYRDLALWPQPDHIDTGDELICRDCVEAEREESS